MVTLENNKYVSAFAESRIGGRTDNQDCFGAAITPFGFLMTVCDGMGGGPAGLTASTIAVNEIIEAIKEADNENTTDNILIRAVRRANKAIRDRAGENPEFQGMGSTCTAVILRDKNAIIAHVGDSRVYQFRGDKIVFRTFDHSMVFELVKKKVLTEEQARLSEQSNVITRALGIKDDVEVEINIVPYKEGDRFLLCTDGIHGAMPEDKLVKKVTRKDIVLGKLVDQIATNVDEIGRNKGGHHDNLTLIIADTLIDSEAKVPPPKVYKYIKYVFWLLCVFFILFGIIKMCKSNGHESIPPTELNLEGDSLRVESDSVSANRDSMTNCEIVVQDDTILTTPSIQE